MRTQATLKRQTKVSDSSRGKRMPRKTPGELAVRGSLFLLGCSIALANAVKMLSEPARDRLEK